MVIPGNLEAGDHLPWQAWEYLGIYRSKHRNTWRSIGIPGNLEPGETGNLEAAETLPGQP